MPAACLLSSGFCRRVYASSASERFVSRLSHCRRRRRQRQRRRRLMSVRFAVGHGSSSTSRDDWWPSCYVLRSLFFSRFLPLLFCSLHHSRLVVPSLLFSSLPFLSFPFLFLLFEPASRNRSHSNILHLWNILKSPFHQAQRSAINRLFPLLLRDPMPKAFISRNIWLFGRILCFKLIVPPITRLMYICKYFKIFCISTRPK